MLRAPSKSGGISNLRVWTTILEACALSVNPFRPFRRLAPHCLTGSLERSFDHPVAHTPAICVPLPSAPPPSAERTPVRLVPSSVPSSVASTVPSFELAVERAAPAIVEAVTRLVAGRMAAASQVQPVQHIDGLTDPAGTMELGTPAVLS